MTAADKSEQAADHALLHVRGEINYQTAPELRARLHALMIQRPARLRVDLSGVPYMDSAGMAVLVEALQTQRRHGLTLELCGLQARVRSLFEIAHLDALFGLPRMESAA